MRKRNILLLVMMLVSMSLLAQKIDPRLTSLVPKPSTQRRAPGIHKPFTARTMESVKQRINVQFSEEGTIKSLTALARLKEGSTCPTAQLEAKGIKVQDIFGSIVVLVVPADRLYELEDVEEFKHVSADAARQLMNDKAREKTQVTWVDGTNNENWAASGLSSKYTGKGVVVGVVDAGIDYNHIAFRNADGTTRVKKVVDYGQVDDEAPAEPVIATDPDEISALTTDDVEGSHGTHTSATAAGSAISGMDCEMQGIAPEADLVLCGLTVHMWDSRIMRGVSEVFEYADEVKKPAVVNLSLGGILGFHDDSSDLTTFLQEQTKEGGTIGGKPGRVIVIASGNEAGDKLSIEKKVGSPDENGYYLKTVIQTENKAEYPDNPDWGTVSVYPGLNLSLYSLPYTYFEPKVKLVNTSTGEIYELDDPTLQDNNLELRDYDTDEVVTSLSFEEDKEGDMKFYYWLQAGATYYVKDPNMRLALFVKGNSLEGKNLIAICPDEPFASCELEGFEDGGDAKSFNTMICTDGVISVGAYVTRQGWTDINGVGRQYVNPYPLLNGLSSFSSYGTDDDGVTNRPDVVAPGSALLSAYNRYDSNYFDDELNVSEDEYWNSDITDVKEVWGSKYYYGAMQGTSMATPCVTGIVALWLEADPFLSVADVRHIMRMTSDNDVFTTDPDMIPSGDLRQAGCGKINALKGLQLLTGETDIVMNDEGIMTYASRYPLDWTQVSTTSATPLQVYYASSSAENGDAIDITMTGVDAATPEGTGLLLKGEKGVTYSVKNTKAAAAAPAGNLLVGVIDDTLIDPQGEGFTNLILANGSHGINWYGISGDEPQELAGGKAYLHLTEADAGDSRIRMTFESDEDATVITRLNGAGSAQAAWYTLEGLRLTGKPTAKGIYIRGNKKVVIK